MSSLVYEASSRTLTFDACVMDPTTDGVHGLGLPFQAEAADAAVPRTFGSGALFIDGTARSIVPDPPENVSGFGLSWMIWCQQPQSPCLRSGQ